MRERKLKTECVICPAVTITKLPDGFQSAVCDVVQKHEEIVSNGLPARSCVLPAVHSSQNTSTPCKDVHVCALCLCISVSPLETPGCCHHAHEVLSQSQPLFSSPLSSFLCVWVCFPASPGARFKKQI